MAFITWIVFGLIVGVLAKFLLPGKDPGGIIVTILIGIAGSVGAGYIGQQLGWYQQGQAAGWIMSIVGAMVLLVLYRMVAGKKR